MASQKPYKRSWKNYLLDANYQLRFTLTMLAVAAGLMAPLGYWVSHKASRATEVALNQIDGVRCPPPLTVTPRDEATSDGDDYVEEEDLLDEGTVLPQHEREEAPEAEGDVLPGGESEAADVAQKTADDAGERPPGESDSLANEERVRPTIKVDIDDSEMPEPVVVVGKFESPPVTKAEIEERNKERSQCLKRIQSEKESVLARKVLIRNVLLFSGLVLLIGLAFYGIKTTHRVAGPLFKVGLYLAKLERNVYDTVYNLRKGDQLVEFYDHFKGAHAGVTKMQEQDRDRLRDAIALSKDAGLAAKDPKLATLVAELEALLDETEKSLGKE